MNKSELIDKMAASTHLTKTSVTRVLDNFIDIVTKTLTKKDYVRLVGFGTFTILHRKATTGHNPRTGAKLKIPASIHPKFKPGSALKRAVNKK